MTLYVKINKNINFIKTFYEDNDKFNIVEYKKLNKDIKELSDIDAINYYNNNKFNKLLSSVKEFYSLYPDFDPIFYKLIYKDIIYQDNFDILSHYHYFGHNENRLYSLDNFKKIYNIDFLFLKNFYIIFNEKTDFEITNFLINNDKNNYICSDKEFNSKFPDFNLIIYKLFNPNIYFENNIKYKSYWYNKGELEKQISSINDFIEYRKDFNLNLYKYIYNKNNDLEESDIIYWFNNKDKLIYNTELLINFMDDFNYALFKKNNPFIQKYNNYNILEYFINNITKITNIYSEKLFYLKNPNINIDELKKFNNIDINKNLILDYYYTNEKNNIIISINDFYEKYPLFNLNLYKNIYYIKYNITFNNDNEYIYHWYKNDINNYYNINNFNKKYPSFNLSIYKYFNRDLIKNLDNKSILYYFDLNKNDNTIYSSEQFYKKYSNFNKDIYKIFNNLENYTDEELIIHYDSIGKPLNLIHNQHTINNLDFNLILYKSLNKDLINLNDTELTIHWFKYGKYQNRIYSKYTFNQIYPNLNFETDNKIIHWMNIGIYEEFKKKNIIGRDIVNNIYEVLIDLSNVYPKNKLEKGISLIIRAKNEECNLKYCIESIVDIVDEIIFVDNNSTDNTYEIMKKYTLKYNNIKLYQYNLDVAKVGIDHNIAMNSKNKNTLATFYNWCLSKSTKYNVFKWDADFICIRNNFVQLIDKYNLRTRNDKFAIWFTGKTLFENNNKYYLNNSSFYDEYRIFSYFNNFCWYDGDTCEYTNPYLDICDSNKKYKYIPPVFYELKRTSLDEFKERSSLIDIRDISDFNILNDLKDNNESKLIEIDINIINTQKKIILYTPSLSLGGGNQFILNIYIFYKSLGYIILIVPMKNEVVGSNKYKNILDDDIFNIKYFTIDFITKFNPLFILFNSDIPFKNNDISILSTITKIYFVTHSDVAYSNTYIEKYHEYFNKIITVNNYTITKLSNLLTIDQTKFLKIVNYQNIKTDNLTNFKKKKFGIISRFSEDKNIPMFILSLVEVFKKYSDYQCYLIGTHTSYYDNYLINLCKLKDLDKNIIFEGYQTDVLKYYEIFDFIVLPSVSEGCSYNIIEAMTLGLPVVTSNVGGNHELIKDKDNGILYDYTNIRDYEKSKIYIENYNEHLSKIGYFINDNDFRESYTINNSYNKLEVIVPLFVNSKNNNDIIKDKIKLFNINLKSITDSIIKIIQMDEKDIINISINNKNFITKYFNESIYLNQILGMLNS